MQNIYDKIAAALKEIKKTKDLIEQGLARPEEKQKAFDIANQTAALFTNDIFKRKVEKISKITNWSMESKDGFVPPNEGKQLDPWIALFEEYNDTRKIKKELSSEKVHIQSVVDGDDQHIFITEKGSNEHTHLVLDGNTGEIRIDEKDKTPHNFVKSIEAKLALKTGETVQITKTSLSFIESETPQTDVRAYSGTKDGYFVIELYNNGDEDLEDFQVVVNWTQPEGVQERTLEKFNDTGDYLVMALPRSLNMLKQGTRVYATGIPSISIDKKIKVTVSCKGMRSKKEIKKVFELETPNQYK